MLYADTVLAPWQGGSFEFEMYAAPDNGNIDTYVVILEPSWWESFLEMCFAFMGILLFVDVILSLPSTC